MNLAFDEVLAVDVATRAGLFTTTGQRIGTTPQNIEKDFWVCWTLDALFNGIAEGPRLLFKGGTSLSKGFGLIRRFSEDIDVTVFRDDLGQACSVDELAEMSGKKRARALDEIKAACEAHVGGALLASLQAIIAETKVRTGQRLDGFGVGVSDEDAQTLLLRYPSATPADDYTLKAVRIESGAKSALDPHGEHEIYPYVHEDLPDFDLVVPRVTIVDPERTFWDKVVILHGLRRWFDKRGELRGGGHRISRHYYDVHALMQSDVGSRALADAALGENCVAHARTFFNRPDYDLATAVCPSFALSPEGAMYDALRIDYAAMAGMIFGDPPAFDAVVGTVAEIETRLNAADDGQCKTAA
jgi:hypothetical protein